MEFEVKAEMHQDGTKTNAKGGIISISRTVYTMIEKKPKDSVGIPIKLHIVIEGSRAFKPFRGDVYKLDCAKEQKKLTDKPAQTSKKAVKK